MVRVTRIENGFMGQLPAWKSPPRVTTHAPNKTLCDNQEETRAEFLPLPPGDGICGWGWPSCHTQFSENNHSVDWTGDSQHRKSSSAQKVKHAASPGLFSKAA